MQISISPELLALWPDASLGVLTYTAEVRPSSEQQLADFEAALEKLAVEYKLETITQNPHVDSTRRAYKALGKSPSEYRNSAEAMLRRIAKGNGLYHINNVIEVNNLSSQTAQAMSEAAKAIADLSAQTQRLSSLMQEMQQ